MATLASPFDVELAAVVGAVYLVSWISSVPVVHLSVLHATAEEDVSYLAAILTTMVEQTSAVSMMQTIAAHLRQQQQQRYY